MSSTHLQPLASHFWRSTSFIDRIKQRIGLAPSATELLTLQINNLAKGIDQRKTIKLVVTYFEENNDPQLEKVLKCFFEKALPAQPQVFDTFIEVTLSTQSLKMLSVIQRIVSLDFLKQKCRITDVLALAKKESVAIPKSIREKAQLTLKGESSQSSDPYALFKTILTFPQKIEIYIIKTLITAIHSSIYTETMTIKKVKENFDFYRLLVKVSSFTFTTFFAFFSSHKKTASLFAISLLASFIYSSFLMKTLDFSEVPEYIDKKKYFTNVNIDIQGKNIKAEKTEENRRLITSYFNGLNKKKEFPPLLLVSDDDSGITNLIRSLAWESKTQSHSPIYGMTFFSVKSIALEQEKYKNFDKTLLILEQCKSRVILHIDARKQTNSSEKISYFLKELLNKKIRCILTLKSDTYKSQYQPCNYINIQKPTIDPKQVELKLRKEVEKADLEMVKVESNVYRPLCRSLEEEDESSPRSCSEAVQQLIREHQYWTPTIIKNKLQVLKKEKDSFVLSARENLRKDPHWSQTVEGGIILNQIENRKTEIQTLQKNKAKQDLQLQKIIVLRRLEFPYYNEYLLYTQLVASAPANAQETLQKRYLLLQHFVRPKLGPLVQKKITKFEKKYQEKIPLKIDGSLFNLDGFPTEMVTFPSV